MQRFVERLRLVAAALRPQGGEAALKGPEIGGEVIGADDKGIALVAKGNQPITHIGGSGQAPNLVGNVCH